MQNFVNDRNDDQVRLGEYRQIQKIQDCFCKLSGIFMYAVDKDGNKITEMSGKEEEVECILDAIDSSVFYDLFRRVMESPLEDQLVEDTEYANLKVAAVAIKQEGKPIICWLACCVLGDMDVLSKGRLFRSVQTSCNRQDFYRALDLVSLMIGEISTVNRHLEDMRAQNRKNLNSAGELERALKRTESMTNVVQLLGQELSFEEVTQEVLKIVGTYLGISSAQIIQISRDGKHVDVVNEWLKKGNVSFWPGSRNVDRPPIFESNKPMVVTRETMIAPEARQYMTENGIRAYMAMPLFVGEETAMYFSVVETETDRVWQVDDVKFVSDVAKVVQSMLIRRIQKNSLAGSFTSLQTILDNVGTCIYVRDVDTHQMLFANNLLKTTFEQELARNTLDELLDRARPLGVRDGYYEVHHIMKGRWYDLYYTYITWVDGRKVSLCALYDITDKKIYQKKIEQQAYTDFLTGLYNRMCCERDLASQIDKAKINHSQGGLLYMDLDDFKHINDGLGHQYGDVLLKSISHSLQQIEGIRNSCYRMGGDEFVIIVPPESYEQFGQIIDEIKQIFSKPWFLKDADYYCTMSMGICRFPLHGDNVQELIKKADLSMYEAKKTGKNRVAEYSGTINSSSNKRLDLEKNMRDASSGNCKEFEVYFQPIIDVQKPGNPCTGAEALIRWNSSALGFIPPSDFIPLAEYLGLINPIGDHVLRQSCIACRKWNENGHPDFKVNVNLSVVQLLQNDIVEKVSDIVKETGINPRNLTLEVTESLAINDMERMREILGRIRSLGVRIALDDFGTGYSSLNHIREIPLDVIKVDQTFVADLAEDEYSRSFIKMVAELANAIDVTICVEGIETEEQYEVIADMKVRLIQGYYFDRPMPQDDFERKYV